MVYSHKMQKKLWNYYAVFLICLHVSNFNSVFQLDTEVSKTHQTLTEDPHRKQNEYG